MRQITAAPKRYISIFIVTTLLIFTVITAELMSGFIKSKNALISMGEPYCELQFAYKEHDSKDRVKVSDVEDMINLMFTKDKVYNANPTIGIGAPLNRVPEIPT